MAIILFHKNLSESEKELFDSYLKQKIRTISKHLTSFAADNKKINATIEKFDKHSAYEVEISVNLPAKLIMAKETSHQIEKAVDLAKDRLVLQLKKHLDTLKLDRTHRSIREEAIQLAAAKATSHSHLSA